MPQYDWICNMCGERFVVLSTVDGRIRPDDACPKCKSKRIRRVPSVPSDPQGGDTPKFYGGK